MIRVRNIQEAVHLGVQVKYIVCQNPDGDSTLLYEVTGDIQRGKTEVGVESGVSADEVVDIAKPYNFVPFNPIEENLTVTGEQIYNMQVNCEYVPNTDISSDEKKQRLADIDTVRALYPPLIDKMFEEDYPEKPIAKEIPIHDYKQAHRILESELNALLSRVGSYSQEDVEVCSKEKAKQILKSAIY